MIEPVPQFTFSSAEGILQLRADERDTRLPVYNNSYLEELTQLPGVEISQGEVASGAILRMNVGETLGAIGDDRRAINSMVHNIGRLNITSSRQLEASNLDRVAYPKLSIGAEILSVGMYRHFQRWLNTKEEPDEALAREVAAAMAIPFGEAATKDLMDNEIEMPNRRNPFAGNKVFGMMLVQTDFHITHQANSLPKGGSVKWTRVSLMTDGMLYDGYKPKFNKALDVTNVAHQPYLYEGVSSGSSKSPALRTFSLLLGMAVLARHAAEYKGEEDILAHAKPGRPQ